MLRAGLSWREVAVLRAYARYSRQLGNPYGVYYMADTLLAHPAVARALLALFRARFDPRLDAGRAEAAEADALATAASSSTRSPGWTPTASCAAASA